MESAPVGLAAVEESLRKEPTSFDFFQAVRLLERLQPDRAPVGYFVDPADEVVRFSVNASIAFPPSEIHSLAQSAEDAARLSVNVMGLTGPLGVLPYHYTLMVAERNRVRDGALGAFYDIFHHRMLSLFYRAWEKHRFTVQHEKQQGDKLEEHLLDLVGMGQEESREELPFSSNLLVFYAGLFALRQRGAVALEQLLEDYFGVPAEIEQFIGGWYPLQARDLCALGEDTGVSEQLGLGAVVGDEVWDQQAKVRIRLGPLRRAEYDEFLPTGSAYETLRGITRFFSHDQFDFELQLVLAGDEVPGLVLGDEGNAPPLGWSTWLRTKPFVRNADETTFSL